MYSQKNFSAKIRKILFVILFFQLSSAYGGSRASYQALNIANEAAITARFRFSTYKQYFEQTAEKVEKNTLRINQYSHRNNISLGYGFFQGNCYGLAAHLIRPYHTKAFSELTLHMHVNKKTEKTWDVQGLPAPLHYVAFLEAIEKKETRSVFWEAFSDVEMLSAGDIISYCSYPKDQETIEEDVSNPRCLFIEQQKMTQHDNSITVMSGYCSTSSPCRGQHIMFVLDRLGTREGFAWFRILDATSCPHGEQDARSQTKEGLGIGEIGLKINAGGSPNTIKWGSLKSPMNRKIKMARLHL